MPCAACSGSGEHVAVLEWYLLQTAMSPPQFAFPRGDRFQACVRWALAACPKALGIRLQCYFRRIQVLLSRCKHACKLCNLTASASEELASDTAGFLISLTIRPTCGVAGAYTYETNVDDLLRLLRRKTELRKTDLDAFAAALRCGPRRAARLSRVSLSDATLADIGYYTD